MTTDPAPASKAPETGQPPAMTPYAIAVVLFAAFAVGGILARQCHYGSSFLPGSRSGRRVRVRRPVPAPARARIDEAIPTLSRMETGSAVRLRGNASAASACFLS
jgi:hypothetical protein